MQSDTPLTPPGPGPEFTNTDAEHLKLLAILHFVYAGFVALGGCCSGIYVFAGLAMATGQMDGNRPPPPELGWMMTAIGGVGILIAWGMALLVVIAGRRLLQRRSHLFCTIMAAFLCIGFPVGTALGVFTLIVLLRPAVQREFAKS